MLSLAAHKKFGLTMDPFFADVTGGDDVYMTPDVRFAAEYLYTASRVGGMVAIIGEVGSGKTVIRRYMSEKVKKEGQKIRLILPRIVDKKKMSASGICDAIIADCSAEPPRRTLEGKARQIEKILTNSSRAGWSHVLMIEEAHDLSIAVLKQLKRFWEMEDGFKKLLAIVLIGQPELKAMLDESRNWEAREVVRRIEVVELEPFSSAQDIAGYLDKKFSRANIDRAAVVTDEACKALAKRLRRNTGDTKRVYSVAYPLLINTWVRRAMNMAADLGAANVDAEVINSL